MRTEPTSPSTDAAFQHDPLLEDLTDAQRLAVTHVDGPLLVLAGPGSGKTRVITRRIAHLVLRMGVPPWNVLAITFTNKAAGEMRARLARVLSDRQARAMTVCTFHSFCARTLRPHAERVGLRTGYSIYDTADQQRAMKRALEALEISTQNFAPRTVLATISNAKNELAGAEDYEQAATGFYEKKVASIYHQYQRILTRNNAADFDDLLLKTVQLFRHHADVLEELQNRYQYILIDEYQDTNHAQLVIANALAAQHTNICATGDPDQSIYGWRGADIRNILEFEQHYPTATVVRLEQNYRSTKRILAAADALIQHNRQRKHKTLWTTNGEGEPIVVCTCHDEQQEAGWLMEMLRELHRAHDVPWNGMAVFYRTNALSRVVEDALRNAGVPYQIARGTAFYDRKEIKDAVAYLRSVANPLDEVNLLRIINTPARGISSRTVKALQLHAVAGHKSMIDVLHQPTEVSSLTARAVKALERFVTMLDDWRAKAGLIDGKPGREPSLFEFVELVIEQSGLHAYYAKDQGDPDQDRLANLGELVSLAQQFEQQVVGAIDGETGQAMSLGDQLDALLEQISLVSDVDTVRQDQGAVTLMTLHSAKGLEYPVVAMIGMEQGLLPHQRSIDSTHAMEEERRLCFVGITRAKQRLLFSHARYRTLFGQLTPTIPSQFLGELPEEHLVAQDISNEGDTFLGDIDDRYANASAQRRAAQQAARQFPVGALVRHPQFGMGRIITVRAMGSQTRAQIGFNDVGVKTVILQYAKLERL